MTLRYLDDDLEADYRQKLVSRARRQFRMTMLTAIPLWPIAALIGQRYVESGLWLWAASGLMCAILVTILLIERGTRTLRGVHLLGLIGNAAAGSVGVAVLWQEGVFGTVGPLAVLMITVFNFGLAGLPFVSTLVASAPYVLAGVGLMLADETMGLVSFQVWLLAIGVAAAGVGAYMREAAQRRDFYLTRTVADQERELERERKKRLGQYTLESKLGQGGMGIVYRARHALLRRSTAVKLLSTEDASEKELARFEREVQLTSELSHPNIVSIYDYGHSPTGEFYYAMEYLPGVDLQSLVDQWGRMPPSRALPILAAICDALEEAHQRGLIHRDIKPSNVLLSRIGTRADVAKVLDFGLVKNVAAPTQLTAENQIVGTPAYLSPEALTRPDEVGPAHDVYAVGAVGFFLLTGEPLFTGATVAEVCAHHIHSQPRRPSAAVEGDIPQEVDEVILRCIEKSPAERYPSAGAVRDALRAIAIEPWREVEDWWDAFDSSREKPDPATGSRKELTVDLGSREGWGQGKSSHIFPLTK